MPTLADELNSVQSRPLFGSLTVLDLQLRLLKGYTEYSVPECTRFFSLNITHVRNQKLRRDRSPLCPPAEGVDFPAADDGPVRCGQSRFRSGIELILP